MPIKTVTALFGVSICATFAVVFFLFSPQSTAPPPPPPLPILSDDPMAAGAAPRSFVLWLHGLGASGPANEPIKNFFTSPQFRNTKWLFPSAPDNPVTCNYGAVMPSWFDIHEIPVTAESPQDEGGLLRAVRNVHQVIDKEIASGTNSDNIFLCGFSQGGALTLASVLLYPKTLGGGAIFSGWLPFNSSIIDEIPPNAKKVALKSDKHLLAISISHVDKLFLTIARLFLLNVLMV